MQKARKFSFRARARSFRYAFQGIATLVRDEHNARIHLVATIVAVALGAVLGISSLEWIAIILCIAAVWALEAVNSAVEALADKVSPEFSPLIRKAKDTAAAAVLIFAIASVVVASIIFIPRIF